MLEFFNRIQACFVIDAGERFSTIKRFAMPVILPVIAGLKRCRARHLACEHTACQRHTR